MRVLVCTVVTALLLGGCGAGQQQGGGTTPANAATSPADPATQQQAIDEVTQLAVAACENGVHGDLSHVATEGPLLIVGTAGEIIEGRASLDEINQNYSFTIRHECDQVQRMAYASAAADVVWVEEALRTHATQGDFSVDFPSQRTMIFERTPEGWRMRYYSLSVRLPDDQLDEAYGEAPTGDAAAAAAPAEAPTE